MLICAQQVEGIVSRGTSRDYLLTGWPFPKCPCVSWAINRNRSVSVRPDVVVKYPSVIAWCKHLEKDYERMCHYSEAKDGSPVIDGMCPYCSGPLVEVESATECRDCQAELKDDQMDTGLCDECLMARI